MTADKLPPPDPGRRQLVVPARGMSTRRFALHMTFRHEEHLGGLSELPDSLPPVVEQSWRLYHQRLHRLAAGQICTVQLACGHAGLHVPGLAKGYWTSCWALTYPRDGCQTQRKVIAVLAAEHLHIEHEHEGDDHGPVAAPRAARGGEADQDSAAASGITG